MEMPLIREVSWLRDNKRETVRRVVMAEVSRLSI